MSGIPIPVRVIGHHILDVFVFGVDNTADLDFVLCDPAPAAAAATTKGDRERLVDYSWLDAAAKPKFTHSDPPEWRVRTLVRWIEQSYTEKCSRELSEVLHIYSNKMSLEYNACLGEIVGDDGRRVEGFLQRVRDRVHITHSIPLLLNDGTHIRRSLSNIVELYAKFAGAKLGACAAFTRADVSLVITCATASRDGPLELLSERISMYVEGRDTRCEAHIVPFIHSCLSFRDLPLYSTALQRGTSLVDYIPSLERSLLVSLREPLHFLKIVLIMSSFFGQPISVNASRRKPQGDGEDGSGGGGDGGVSLLRSAAFCVVDDATQFGFSICMRYHNGWTLPSIGIIANQYMITRSQESLLRAKLQYPEALQRLEQSSSSSGGLIDPMILCDAIQRASFETMSFLVSTCQ